MDRVKREVHRLVGKQVEIRCLIDAEAAVADTLTRLARQKTEALRALDKYAKCQNDNALEKFTAALTTFNEKVTAAYENYVVGHRKYVEHYKALLDRQRALDNLNQAVVEEERKLHEWQRAEQRGGTTKDTLVGIFRKKTDVEQQKRDQEIKAKVERHEKLVSDYTTQRDNAAMDLSRFRQSELKAAFSVLSEATMEFARAQQSLMEEQMQLLHAFVETSEDSSSFLVPPVEDVDSAFPEPPSEAS